MAASVFNAILTQANLITKTDCDTKLPSPNRNITSNKSKHLLVESEINHLKKLSLDYFLGKPLSDREDDSQNYLVLQPMYK